MWNEQLFTKSLSLSLIFQVDENKQTLKKETQGTAEFYFPTFLRNTWHKEGKRAKHLFQNDSKATLNNTPQIIKY